MGSSPKAGRRPRLHPSRQSPAASASQLAGRQTKRRGGAHTGAKRLPARSHPPFYRQSMLLFGLRRAAASAPKSRDKEGRHAPAHHPIVRPGEKAAPEAAPARRRGDRLAPFASPLSLTKPADALSRQTPHQSVDRLVRPPDFPRLQRGMGSDGLPSTPCYSPRDDYSQRPLASLSVADRPRPAATRVHLLPSERGGGRDPALPLSLEPMTALPLPLRGRGLEQRRTTIPVRLSANQRNKP